MLFIVARVGLEGHTRHGVRGLVSQTSGWGRGSEMWGCPAGKVEPALAPALLVEAQFA